MRDVYVDKVLETLPNSIQASPPLENIVFDLYLRHLKISPDVVEATQKAVSLRRRVAFSICLPMGRLPFCPRWKP